jgi:hypothetical protein
MTELIRWHDHARSQNPLFWKKTPIAREKPHRSRVRLAQRTRKCFNGLPSGILTVWSLHRRTPRGAKVRRKHSTAYLVPQFKPMRPRLHLGSGRREEGSADLMSSAALTTRYGDNSKRSCALFRRCGGMLTRPLAVQIVAAVADMQRRNLNVTSSVSILHTVSEPRHRVGHGKATTVHV